MQYGSLLSSEQDSYLADQSSQVRNPTYNVVIEGLDDINDNVMFIMTDNGFENEVIMHPYIGHANIMVDNTDESIIENNISKIAFHAKIIISFGFNGNNIKTWEGFIYSVQNHPQYGYVDIYAYDGLGKIKHDYNFGFLYGDTIKEVIDNIAGYSGVLSNVPNTGILKLQQDNKDIDLIDGAQIIQRYIELTGRQIFIDAQGKINAEEVLNSTDTSYVFDDNNVINIIRQNQLPQINEQLTEYRLNMFQWTYDTDYMALYGRQSKYIKNDGYNYETIANDYKTGNIDEKLTNIRTAFKITTPSDANILDTVWLAIKKDNAVGYISAELYNEDSNLPDTLLGTTGYYDCEKIMDGYTWVALNFPNGIPITLSHDYWVSLNTENVSSGTLNMYIQDSSFSSMLATMETVSSAWTLESDKMPIHQIFGSQHAYNINQKQVTYYKAEHDRYILRVPGIAHIELFDNAYAKLAEYGIDSRVTVERIRHYMSTASVSLELLEALNITSGGFLTDIYIRT